MTTTWGRRPLRLRTRLRASLRAFWARSLRRVHLHDTTACRIGLGWTDARSDAWVATVSSTRNRWVLISASVTGARETTTSGAIA